MDIILKWFAVGASYLAIGIGLYRANKKAIEREAKQNAKIKEMEKTIIENKEKHERDLSALKASVEKNRDENREEHGKLFSMLGSVSEGVARIEGFLKAQSSAS